MGVGAEGLEVDVCVGPVPVARGQLDVAAEVSGVEFGQGKPITQAVHGSGGAGCSAHVSGGELDPVPGGVEVQERLVDLVPADAASLVAHPDGDVLLDREFGTTLEQDLEISSSEDNVVLNAQNDTMLDYEPEEQTKSPHSNHRSVGIHLPEHLCNGAANSNTLEYHHFSRNAAPT